MMPTARPPFLLISSAMSSRVWESRASRTTGYELENLRATSAPVPLDTQVNSDVYYLFMFDESKRTDRLQRRLRLVETWSMLLYLFLKEG